MSPKTPRLTRDELVTIISDYYTFLTKFYLPSSAVKYPPPGGWPNITPEATKDLDKSAIVIELIKHLPYIERPSADEHDRAHNIHYKSDVIDYSVLAPDELTTEWFADGAESLQEWWDDMAVDKAERGDEDGDDENEDESEEDVDGGSNTEGDNDDEDSDNEENWWDGDDPDDFQMTNMVVLALGSESGGRTLILDVFKGNIYEDMIRCDLLPSCPVESFFEDLREKFKKLELVPTLGEMYEGESDIDDGNEKILEAVDVEKRAQSNLQSNFEVKQFRKIWREHGWPGEGFRKEEALAAIRECRGRLDIY